MAENVGKSLGCHGCEGEFASADELDAHEQASGHGQASERDPCGCTDDGEPGSRYCGWNEASTSDRSEIQGKLEAAGFSAQEAREAAHDEAADPFTVWLHEDQLDKAAKTDLFEDLS